MTPRVKIRTTENGWYANCGLYLIACELGADFEQTLVLRRLFKVKSEPFVHPYEWRSVDIYLDSLFQKFGDVAEDVQDALRQEIREFIAEKRKNGR